MYWEFILNNVDTNDFNKDINFTGEIFKDLIIPGASLISVFIIYYLTNKFQIESNRPVFTFEPIKLLKEVDKNDMNFLRHAIVDSNDENIDDYIDNKFISKKNLKPRFYFRNIGNSYAKDITITIKHVDPEKYFNDSSLKTLYPMTFNNFEIVTMKNKNNDFKLLLKRIENLGFIEHNLIYGDYKTKKHFRICPVNEKVSMTIEENDITIFNHNIMWEYAETRPYIIAVINYKDKYNKKYEDEILISLDRSNLNSNSLDNFYTVYFEVNEIDKYYIQKYPNKYIN
ncbi:hypothetical protein [Macrococcoides caseolyticum]|uniref:hypothetical protein n=1 Tax=Macrococcoides caseolyticum TaxID=69966 RepID=UPI001F193FD3|nr:hypothetical protein [Macrococcus caseolyticus]MCE4957706.1 hypothetical protein [Macrococcus caseolyticus]